MNTKAVRTTGGIAANTLVTPIVIILTILHILIIVLIASINMKSSSLSRTMQDSGIYIEEATSLLGGSSLLSETCTTFILMPLTETGEANIGPLVAYAAELPADRRGDAILERFRGYDVSPEASAALEEAAGCANAMIEAQLHAIALMRSVYPVPEIPALAALTAALPELTEGEAGLTEAERVSYARILVLGTEYGVNKQTVSTDVSACVGILRQDAGQRSAEASRSIMLLRTAMWITTMAIVVVLAGTFIILYRSMIHPLRRFVALIAEDDALDESRGLAEVRLVANAYNDLLDRRNSIERLLRLAAETDRLTNLQNRYGFEKYFIENGKRGYSMALVMFDVNYLKQTNDTLGHAAGDKLLRDTADCISECFGAEGNGSCFRFGGDEFAAVIRDTARESVDRMVEVFKKEQQRRKISVSWGVAYTPDIGTVSVQYMLDEADKRMYEQKRRMHDSGPGPHRTVG